MPDPAPAESRTTYEMAFVRNCLRLLSAGHGLLDAPALASADEPVITGELVRAMKAAQDSPQAPRWMDHLYVADDPPVNSPDRFGKQRLRVDIEFEGQRRPRPHFQCEAKRLHQSGAVREYLGTRGMQLFLSGAYARPHGVAGMLGYVQAEEPEVWLDRIQAALVENPEQHGIEPGGEPVVSHIADELPHTRRSVHGRPTVGRSIALYHVLLRFRS